MSVLLDAIVSGLCIVAISGAVLMYRQIGELKAELRHLARAIEILARDAREERTASREETHRLHERIDTLREVGEV
jgi:outer membrane murein-binding lipoprotein Lpp